MALATVVPLPFWQDPVGDILLFYSERECCVYFNCWRAAGEPADFLGQLVFEGAVAIRCFGREFLPYEVPTHSSQSYLLIIPDSDMVREHAAYRNRHYAGHPGGVPDSKHFVVRGHDIYHEILATKFTAKAIQNDTVSDPRLLQLIAQG